jgi:DNA-binding beta-propeller fold protein YncE
MKILITILSGFLAVWLLVGCGGDSAPAATAAAPAAANTPAVAPGSGPAALVLSISGGPNPLAGPNDLELDGQGNLYVADGPNNRIQKFDSSGQFVTMWGSPGQGDGQFNFFAPDVSGSTAALAVDAQGNVYVADWGNHRIQKFDSQGQFLAKWGSRGKGDGQFLNLIGLTSDPEGNLYALDNARADIQKFDGSGQFLTKWGSVGKEDGQFNAPAYLTADDQGNIYVVDGFNNRIQKFDSSGQFLAKWGRPGKGDGQFSFISGEYAAGLGAVAVDEQGNVYVADYGNNRIQKFDGSGQFLAKWGSSGIGDNQFNHPIALTVDPAGRVYIADFGNNRIQIYRQ